MTASANIRVVAVTSPLGGTGRTTLTAHLASFLTLLGHPCLAVDLCPQNMLGTHLGQQQAAEAGWASLAARQQWWGQAALTNSDTVSLLPFGAASPSTLDQLQNLWALHPEWLQQQLDGLDLSAGSTVFLDTPLWPEPLARQALAAASVSVIVLEASARACHAQALVEQALAWTSPDSQQAIVVNRVDPRRPSQRDALQTLQTQWRGLLLPYTVHDDENIAQACEEATSVCAWAPHAQSSHDFQGIGRWLVSLLSAMSSAPADGQSAALPA